MFLEKGRIKGRIVLEIMCWETHYLCVYDIQ